MSLPNVENRHVPDWSPVTSDEVDEFEERNFRYIEQLTPELQAKVQAIFQDLFEQKSRSLTECLAIIDHSTVLLPLNPQTLVSELGRYLRTTSGITETMARLWRVLEHRVARNVSLEEIHLERRSWENLARDMQTRIEVLERELMFLVNDRIDPAYFVTSSFHRDIVEFLQREHVDRGLALFWSVLDRLQKKLPHRAGAIRMIREIAQMSLKDRKRILGEEVPPLS